VKRVVVGVDGSAGAESALRWAAAVAGAAGSGLVARSAWAPKQAELPPDESEREHGELQALLAARLDGVHDVVPDAVSEVIDGEAVDVLLEGMGSQDGSLLVVGLRGEGGFPLLRVGSVADALAHHTPVPLALVPEGAQPGVRRIVLGLDGSDGAGAAARWCAGFARELGAEVLAACAYGPLVGRFHAHDVERVRDQARDELRGEWVAPLRDAGVAVREELVSGTHAADALLTAAEATAADLIVIGTHGLVPVIRMRLGGVALRLLHETSVPLVLVPTE
jgi:nucleotide-binding universal stress UspA family protein